MPATERVPISVVAKETGLTVQTVHRWASTGKIPAQLYFGRWFVAQSVIPELRRAAQRGIGVSGPGRPGRPRQTDT